MNLNFILKNINIKALILSALFIASLQLSNAQYCTSGATSTTDEFITNVKMVDNSNGAVLLNNNSWQPSTTVCAQYTDYTSLKPFNLSAGAQYTVSVTVGYCGTSVAYNNQALVWIDYNKNNAFEASEAVKSTPSAYASGIRDINFTFTVPCNITPGTTRMRCVLSETTTMTNPGSACGTYTWGETEDYSVNVQLPTSVSSSFIAPASVWVKSKANFINDNPTGYITHAWDINNDGTVEAPNSVNYSFTWTTPGTKCVKLKSTNCLGSDSIVKCLSVNAPTQKPVANFIANRVTVEQYDIVKLFDLSTNGPWEWKWDVYDSTTYANSLYYPNLAGGDVLSNPNNNGSTEFSQNPEFMFNEPGCYVVELTSRNDIGYSAVKKKICYITVTLPTDYYLGSGSYGPNLDNIVGSPSGTIIDNGGTTANYTNGQGYGTRSYLLITPCNAKKIELSMTQLKFGANDNLRVWDGKNSSGTLLATWNNSNKSPLKVTATSGSMFILFESDAAGVDSGYLGTYKSELGPAVAPTPAFTTVNSPNYNSTPIKFINTTQNIVGVPTWEWTLDGAVFSNKAEPGLTMYTDGKYEVCLEIKSCVGNNKSCDSINVITPFKQTYLDFTASNRRPKAGADITTLTPISDNANRFEWTIFPTTYTLMNPPSNPSKYGTGYVHYNATPGDSLPTPIIKFTAPGCYTIALKAYNDLDTNATIKTIVKNKFICALNYCAPNAYIISDDIGINRVRLLDGSNELFNNASTSGDAAYTDYSSTVSASVTYGKKYTLEMTRNSTIDSANRKFWIDWNIDGDFDDANEEIYAESSRRTQIMSYTFTVPSLAKSFEGMARLRVATNFLKENTTPCGPLAAGEYEDYGLLLYNDNQKPVITLKGSDTVRMEVNSAYVDDSATAYDISEGDITSEIEMTSDLDVLTTGIYTIEYNVTDKSGNKATTVVRTIIVENDRTPPVLTLNPDLPGCIEATRKNDPYVDPGASAYNTNPFVNLTNSIIVKGKVDTRKIGTYTLTYSVKDDAGNGVVKTRTVCVTDGVKPLITNFGDTSVQIGSTWVDQTTAIDDYDDNPVLTRQWLVNPVNTTVRNTYTVTYQAVDQSGNQADPVTVNYRVDDFVPPVINLNTFDIVTHKVTEKYVSITATVSDNFYGPGQVSVTRISSNVDPNKLGTYSEVFKAVDGSGNISFKTRTVNVVDIEAPVIWGETIYACVGDNIWPLWGVTTTDNYYSPQVLKPLVEIIKQNVNPNEEGIYSITYRVTDPSGNKSLPYTTQVVYTYWPKCYNSTTGLKKAPNADDAVSVYPNPTTGIVTLDLETLMAKNATIEVFNAMGQQVLTQNYSEATGKFTVDLTGLAKGVYTIKLKSEGQIVVKRVILQ
ncbi:MAG: immunoglobulin-like domain-containing protein [Bacteroidota bacterium]